MRKVIGLSLGLCLLSAGSGLVLAQQNADGTTPPPKVLVTTREFLKPGKQGTVHERSESAFVRAMEAAKYPTHYFAMNSLSGPTRALFLVGYGSFEDFEKDNAATASNATLSAALDHAMVADGELLSGFDQAIWTYDEDDSFRASVKIADMRFMDLTLFKVKPGHRGEWHQLVKLYKDGLANVPGAHWATFEGQYGVNGYLVATPMRSLSEVDQEMQDDKQFRDALGPDGIKKLEDLERSCVESVSSTLYQFAPKMSYVPDAWVKADPGFWKVKSEAPAKKAAAKANQ